jgi:hypothetical protein
VGDRPKPLTNGIEKPSQEIAAFGSSYTDPVGAAEGCDLLIFNKKGLPKEASFCHAA